MESGTYAVDPETGAIVVAPGDTRGTVLIPEKCDGSCFGPDGRDGPNLACAHCGRTVATRIDDCSYWLTVEFEPDAVRHLPADSPVHRPVEWEAVDRQGTPPIEPSGMWSPVWQAAIGSAVAHLLAVSEGAPVAVPDGLVADTFGPTLNGLLPPGPPMRTGALAGPGLPAPSAEIVLVPRHPVSGELWQPSGGPHLVPVAAEVWMQLAFRHEQVTSPVTGGMPDGVLRDDPLPRHPYERFRPDSGVFLHTLARLSAVREPWLRSIYDRVKADPYGRPF
jgi:hypothetical protein